MQLKTEAKQSAKAGCTRLMRSREYSKLSKRQEEGGHDSTGKCGVYDKMNGVLRAEYQGGQAIQDEARDDLHPANQGEGMAAEAAGFVNVLWPAESTAVTA